MHMKPYHLLKGGILAAAAVLMLAACSQKAAEKLDINDFMKEEGIRLTTEMKDLAASKEYLEAMGLSGMMDSQIEAIASQDYSSPQEVYVMPITDEQILSMLFIHDNTLSEEVVGAFHRRLNASFYANLINARDSDSAIAAATALLNQQSYVEPENWRGDTLVILKYPGDYSSVVSFMETGDGVIGSCASFVKTGGQDIVDEITDLFALDGDSLVKLR